MTLRAPPGTPRGDSVRGAAVALELLSGSGVHPVDISSSLFDQLRWMSDAGHAIFSGVKP